MKATNYNFKVIDIKLALTPLPETNITHHLTILKLKRVWIYI